MKNNIDRALQVVQGQQHREEVKELLDPVRITPMKEKEAKILAKNITKKKHSAGFGWDGESTYL